jgi:transketolase
MPSTSVFDKQDVEYKRTVIPQNTKFKVAIEAGVSNPWYKYVGMDGLIIGVDTFGESAKASDLFEHFGLTAEKVLQKINTFIRN